MGTDRQVTVMQTSAVIVSTIIGVGVLSLPLFAARAADSAAPIVTLLGISVAFAGIILIACLGMRFPNQSLIQYSETILGRWLAAVGSLLVIAFFAVLTSLTAREFGEVVVTSVLQRTPLEVTVIVMLLLAAVSARNTVTTLSYIHTFYFPFLVVPGLLIAVLSMNNSEAINLQPFIWTEPGKVLKGVMTVAALFQGYFILTVVIPHMRKPKKALKASLWGVAIAGGLYLIIVVAAVSVFGAQEIKKLLWPTLELAKGTSLPANVLERLDAAFLAVWVTAVFTTLLSSYYLTSISLSQLFRLEDHKMFAYILLPFIFLAAMLPQNVVQLYDIIEIAGRFGLVLTIGYPSLLLLIAVIRRKRGMSYESR